MRVALSQARQSLSAREIHAATGAVAWESCEIRWTSREETVTLREVESGA